MDAFARAAAFEHLRLKRHVDSLAAIATAAPLAGFLGACLGIWNAFRGTAGERYTLMALVFLYLAEALLPAAAGIAIGLVALFFHRVLIAQHARLAIPSASELQ
jgi:biopolymer transport protein ExbB